MTWVILGSAFLASFVLSIFFLRYFNMRPSRVVRRIAEIEQKDWQDTNDNVNKRTTKNAGSKVSNILWRIFSHFKVIRILEEKLQSELKKANILMKSKELLVLILISGILGGVLGILIAGGSVNRGIWVGLITWLIPLNWIKIKKRKRKEKLETQLPDMISMTANSLKAGYSLMQSLELLSREMAAPLSEELQRMLQEMRLGVTTEQALINFNERIESKDLDLIITAMLIQRQVGGNLAEILDTIGETIRERIRIEGELKALTAQGRMSMIIFMILPIALGAFLFMSNPEYMMVLFTDPLGWVMLGLALVGQAIGVILIKRIIKIEV